MLDRPIAPAAFLADLKQGFGGKAPTLPTIFQVGDRIEETGAEMVPVGTPTQRIAVLGATTIDYLRRAVACGVLREGVFPIVYQAPFGSYVQEVLDPGSALHAFKPELAVIATHWRDLVADMPIGCTAADVDAALESKVALFRSIWGRLTGVGAKIVQHLAVPPQQRFRGVAERLAPASPANQIRRLNDKLLEAGNGLVTWIDMEALATKTGTGRFSPAKFYFSAKLDYDQRWLPDYLAPFQSAWRSANAKAKKVLVLDLDNTVWGGVIGDDGVEGIKLGAASPAGEAFEDWQRYIKGLSERGIILAVCSKNAPEIAETGFTHPNSVLKREDFAAFECSWSDKAGGMKRIAQTLNVGIDSFVFCDDNPAECELVRQELPDVAVVHMGTDPAAFIDLFDAGHWFDMQAYTTEDLGRAQAYAARAAALAEQEGATDIGGYLAGLDMKGKLYRPDEADIARVAQLELKTNQFNVTTRRYSETQVRGFMERNDAVVLAFRLADRFGDHGLTSTLVAFQEDDAMRIDSWLMSCRVFSRSAEQYILKGLIDIAEGMGATKLVGEYKATPKNDVVADLYPRMGFTVREDGLYERPLGSGREDLVTYIAGV
ncbi:MAG: HAD-IIIC family phosphatase [Rhodospirillales bacterium]